MNIAGVYWQQCCKQWNVPNTITLSRVLLGLTLYIWWEVSVEIKLIILLYAGISDGLDGWLARIRGTQTPLGAIFDPLADKLFTNPFLVAVAISIGGVFVWALLVVNVLYDIDNTYRRRGDILLALNGKKGSVTKPVTKLSKWKTACLFIFMALAVLSEWFLWIPVQAAAGVCLLLVLWSWGLNRRDSFKKF